MRKIIFGIVFLLCFLVVSILTIKNLLPASSKNSIKDTFLSTLSIILTGNNTVKFENPKKSFSRQETPQFEIAIPYKSNTNIGKGKVNAWSVANEKISVVVKKLSTNTAVPAVIYKKASGKFAVVLDSKEKNNFGKYTITIAAKESFVYERNLSQDFNWGVLAINTNKSIYLPNETARLGFGVLDERGNTLCGAKLNLVISDPDNNKQNLSTENGSIKKNPKCFGNYYSLEEDYTANYKTGKVGRYYMNLTAETNNGPYTISDYFEVRDSVPFDIERTQFPSRIYPVEAYPVKLTVKANEDYKGTVYDMVPIDFEISNISDGGRVSRTKNEKLSNSELAAALLDEAKHLGEKNYKIKYNKDDLPSRVDKSPVKVMWDVDFHKGQTYTLTYSIYFPQVSPEYYLLGPVTIGSFSEIRDWQVASDATKCWDGGGADNNWNTAANWASDTNPTTTSNATFHGGTCTAGTPDKSVTVNVDPSLTGTGGGITISSNYSGTMTQSNGVTMTLSGTIGFVMAGGTFQGGDSTSPINTSLFNMTGGAFTSTAGTLNDSGNWTSSAGTFTHNSGLIALEGGNGSSMTATGSITFYKLSFISDCNNGATFTIANGTALTVNNTLTFSSGCIGFLTGTGTISAKGDITATGGGIYGDAVVTINGTGSQTFTGDPSTDPFVPAIVINKTSGTLSFVDHISEHNNWTYTQGTLSMGTSTIIYQGDSASTLTITGTMSYYGLKFLSDCNNGATFTIASGTTLTSTGTLTFSSSCSGSVNGPGAIQAQGDITTTGGGIYGDAVVTINGTGSQTFTGDPSTDPFVPAIVINKTSGTLSFVDHISEHNNWTYTQGTLSMGTSTIIYQGDSASTLTITGSMTYYGLKFQSDCNNGATFTIASGTTLTSTSTLTLNSGCLGTLNGPGTIHAQGDITSSGSGIDGDILITLDGSSNQTVTAAATVPSGNVTINKSAGTATLANNLSLNATGQSLAITSGTLNLASYNLTVNSTFTIGSSGTLKLQGGETVTTPTTISAGGTVEYNGAGTYSSLAAGSDYSNLTISGSGSFTPAANITVSGNFTQSAGTFNVAPSGMTVSGNFARSGGSFTPGSSTVTFDNAGVTTTLSGSTSFYNFTSITPGKIIDFTNGTTTTVTNTLTLRGSSAGLLTLASTSPGSAWSLTVNGTATLSKLSVQDSNACGGSNSPLIATGSLSISGNSCWTISGSYTGWYNNSWTQRRTITIDHTKVAGDQTDFPVLIKLSSDSSLASSALDNGNDILFTSEDGTTKIPHDIEKFDGTTGEIEVWVKVPTLSSSSDTTLFMYYGNAAASDQRDKTNVWDTNYKGVWHLPDGTTLSATDSTSNANNGTISGVTATTGQIDGSGLFDSSSDQVNLGNNSSLRITGNLTLSAWVKAINAPPGGDDGHVVSSSHSAADAGYLLKSSHDLGTERWAIQISGTGSDSIQRYSTTVRSLGTWYYVVGVYNASAQTLHIYVNGALDDDTLSGTVPASIHSSANNVLLGRDPVDANMSFDGSIDEVHISATTRSATWIQTEYNNQSSPSTFFSISAGIALKPVSSFRGGTKIRGGTSIKSN